MFARRVAVIGTGYVGLTTGACLASLGHRVSCADLDRGKVERLRRGEIGIREDGLSELVEAGIAAGRLSFVVGASKPDAAERVAALFARLGAPTVLTDAPSAEMIKYAANCFLAMKLSLSLIHI